MNSQPLFTGKYIEIIQEGPELVALTRGKGLEYSRLNLQTKRATHWYARLINDRIYIEYPNKNQALSICCLGSSMGAIPYELLYEYPNSKVVCVDIDLESLYILEYSILKSFGKRVLYKDMDAKEFVETMKQHSYDIIINDLFSEDESPEFVNTKSFLQRIWNGLKPTGFYFANTYTDHFDTTHGSLLEQTGFHVLRYPYRNTGKTNVIYEAKKLTKKTSL